MSSTLVSIIITGGLKGNSTPKECLIILLGAGYLVGANAKLKKDRTLLVWLHHNIIGKLDLPNGENTLTESSSHY